MKRTVEWHKESLVSRKEYLLREEAIYARHGLAIKRLRASVEFLENQIKEAERLGKDDFDSDRFMQRREGDEKDTSLAFSS